MDIDHIRGSAYLMRNGCSPALLFWIGGETLVEAPVSEAGRPLKSGLVSRIMELQPAGLTHEVAIGVAEGFVAELGGNPDVASSVYHSVVKPAERRTDAAAYLREMHAELRELYSPTAALD